MSHRNARLTPRGRLLLVQRVRVQGMPVAHVAKAMGVSRQCAHRWVKRFDEEGQAGLEDRSSRPKRSPGATDPRRVAKVLKARRVHRCGPAELALMSGVPERTVTRILRRHGMPRLPECDPMTGEVIRASRATTLRYEREHPGELVHVDVKKLGKIPDGGGWRANGRGPRPESKRHIGYDYVHSMVDDHSRFAYSEILGDETPESCAAFLHRAAEAFASAGIAHIAAVMTDNAKNYTHSRAGRPRRSGDRPPADQAPLPLAERESRETQPDPPDRMGLPPPLPIQYPADPCAGNMALALQQRAPPQCPWGPAADQSAVMNVVAKYS